MSATDTSAQHPLQHQPEPAQLPLLPSIGPHPVEKQKLTIQSLDNFPLSATLHFPSTSTTPSPTTPTILIQSATGVLERFYHPFASFLASHGFIVLSYDYRGIGNSLPPPPSPNKHPLSSSHHITISDTWATKDQPAMIHYLTSHYPTRELVLIGNSVGGHIPALSPNADKISRMLFVSVNSAYWRNGQSKSQILFTSYIAYPLLVPLFGYFPSKKMGLFEDIPAGVMREWMEFSRYPKYILGRYPELTPNFEKMNCKILGLSFTDDDYVTERGFSSFLELYKNCERFFVHVKPGEKGRWAEKMDRVAHFGFFMENAEKKAGMWSAVLPFLKEGKLGDTFEREVEIEKQKKSGNGHGKAKL